MNAITNPSLFLANWSDIHEPSEQIITYDTLIESDDEWLTLASLTQLEADYE